MYTLFRLNKPLTYDLETATKAELFLQAVVLFPTESARLFFSREEVGFFNRKQSLQS